MVGRRSRNSQRDGWRRASAFSSLTPRWPESPTCSNACPRPRWRENTRPSWKPSRRSTSPYAGSWESMGHPFSRSSWPSCVVAPGESHSWRRSRRESGRVSSPSGNACRRDSERPTSLRWASRSNGWTRESCSLPWRRIVRAARPSGSRPNAIPSSIRPCGNGWTHCRDSA